MADGHDSFIVGQYELSLLGKQAKSGTELSLNFAWSGRRESNPRNQFGRLLPLRPSADRVSWLRAAPEQDRRRCRAVYVLSEASAAAVQLDAGSKLPLSFGVTRCYTSGGNV